MAGVDDIIKQWVQQAERTGEVRKLPGFGEPFDFQDGYLETPAKLRMAYRVLRNAGYVPAELELLARLETLRGELEAATSADRQRELQVQIAETRQKVAMMFEALRR